jgi:hypothetical protein
LSAKKFYFIRFYGLGRIPESINRLYSGPETLIWIKRYNEILEYA